MRLLILTLEFSIAAFSGNGIYAQSQVRALRALGHRVLVVCGRPAEDDAPAAVSGPASAQPEDLHTVPLPRWGKLDHNSGWREFADGVASTGVADAVAAFQPQVAIGVDWHSLPAFEALGSALRTGGHPVPPYVYMNYRVYTRSADEEERDLAKRLETAAVAAAAEVVTLSRADAGFVAEKLAPPGRSIAPKVLLPALRDDMARLPLPDDVSPMACASLPGGASPSQPPDAACPAKPAGQSAAQAEPATAATAAQQATGLGNGLPAGRRRYLTCCVRLSPEKEPHRFVELVEFLSRAGALARLGVTPLLCGAATTPYAEAQRNGLRAAAPDAVVERRFLGPAELAQVYAETALNFHPCAYDAYGMTIVEAASQGAPSVVAAGGAVGATALLRADREEAFVLDFSVPTERLAKQVTQLLEDAERLRSTGSKAASRAREWTEEANAAELIRMIHAVT